jgi:hypothetical protein
MNKQIIYIYIYIYIQTLILTSWELHAECNNSGAFAIILLLAFPSDSSNVRVVLGQRPLRGQGVWVGDDVITEDSLHSNHGNQGK